jgi:hypothetical protein
MQTRKCPIFLIKFVPTNNRQKYNLPACRAIAFRKRHKTELKFKRCKQCGERFPVTKLNKLYCKPAGAKKADNNAQRLRKMAEAAAVEIVRQRKVEASSRVDLAVAVEKIYDGPGRLPKVTIRIANDAAAALAQALEDQAGAERAAKPRAERAGFTLEEVFSARDCAIAQQKADQQSQGQGISEDTLLKIKASQKGD